VRKQYSAPIVEKIVFDYSVQTSATSACYESVLNERPAGSTTQCVGGTPIGMGWTLEQTLV